MVQNHVEQPAVVARVVQAPVVEVPRQAIDRSFRPICGNAHQTAFFFGHQKVPVRQKRQRPWVAQPRGDKRGLYIRWGRRLRRRGTGPDGGRDKQGGRPEQQRSSFECGHAAIMGRAPPQNNARWLDIKATSV
jgi:hypothetical protein